MYSFVNIKTETLTCDYSIICVYLFMQQTQAESLLKDLSSDIIIHIWRLQSFRDVVEKPELVDTNYPW